MASRFLEEGRRSVSDSRFILVDDRRTRGLPDDIPPQAPVSPSSAMAANSKVR